MLLPWSGIGSYLAVTGAAASFQVSAGSCSASVPLALTSDFTVPSLAAPQLPYRRELTDCCTSVSTQQDHIARRVLGMAVEEKAQCCAGKASQQ